jgi:hypothetical protein
VQAAGPVGKDGRVPARKAGAVPRPSCSAEKEWRDGDPDWGPRRHQPEGAPKERGVPGSGTGGPAHSAPTHEPAIGPQRVSPRVMRASRDDTDILRDVMSRTRGTANPESGAPSFRVPGRRRSWRRRRRVHGPIRARGGDGVFPLCGALRPRCWCGSLPPAARGAVQ